MRTFVLENWYKLMIGSSLLMASFGFMVHSVSPVMADDENNRTNLNSHYKLIPTNSDGSINVKFSDVQLSKIIPKNEDGSINVKMIPNTLVDVNITHIKGYEAASIKGITGNRGLLVGTCTDSYDCN
jgi:hypothetical protein